MSETVTTSDLDLGPQCETTPSGSNSRDANKDEVGGGGGDGGKGATATGSRLKRILLDRFPNEAEEELYQEYMRSQKLKIIPAFVASAAIYLVMRLCLDIVVFDITFSISLIGVHSAFLLLTVGASVLITYKRDMPKAAVNGSILFLWALVALSLLLDVGLQRSFKTASKGVGWVQMVIFTTFVVVPWKLRCCVGLGVVIMVAYSVEETTLWILKVHHEDERLSHTVLAYQVIANCILFVGAILLGVLVFVFSEKMQRRSFVESKKSHAVSHQIEKEYKEQKRLLLSVLPKHVADEMMQDMGTESSGQFRKIYMSRHENVSILFADIVGFTAISSSVTAGELVKILNHLFASFDDLANKYHQQRIKILGDCYYSVCGALQQRPDHAVLCIHMGVSVVDAISDVRNKTGKDVNMRVGIHTGSVLGGVLGQKHWQYDVLGKEVTMANHMESGGLPARVHISEATMRLLNGEFELEAGCGADRDDYLRLHNVQTYFIKSIIKPYPAGTLDAYPEQQESSVDGGGPATAPPEKDSDVSNEKVNQVMSLDTLRTTLLNRTRSRTAMKQLNVLTTWFHDSETEARYRQRREHFSGASMGALCVVFVLIFLAKLVVLPWTLLTIVIFIAAEVILIFMAVISSVLLLKEKLPRPLLQLGLKIDRVRLARLLWAVSAVAILMAADSTLILQCDVHKAQEALVNGSSLHFLEPHDQACPYPAYFVHAVHLILLGVSSLVHIEHMTKLVIIVVCTSATSAIYIHTYGTLFDFNDAIVYGKGVTIVPSKYQLSVQLISASLALLVLNRKMEEISRRLFMWREEAEKQTKRATELRHKNKSLVYNILPEHVARAFTGTQRRHMDLYSHAYEDTAVMFAACPNFHDFYNESAVNNEGLECLRFLNEIISDYDELLNQRMFKSITKIKTVGPTYMAASGMVSTPDGPKESEKEKDFLLKWEHLDILVQFALTMKDELDKINKQSFNNFILRIGINHGPVIAGVIGARKPHYDIWGNTVNVASRMESTGMGGKIQVVEETKVILEKFGYHFKKRGKVKVKGKGELVTYFLEGQEAITIHSVLSTSMVEVFPQLPTTTQSRPSLERPLTAVSEQSQTPMKSTPCPSSTPTTTTTTTSSTTPNLLPPSPPGTPQRHPRRSEVDSGSVENDSSSDDIDLGVRHWSGVPPTVTNTQSSVGISTMASYQYLVGLPWEAGSQVAEPRKESRQRRTTWEEEKEKEEKRNRVDEKEGQGKEEEEKMATGGSSKRVSHAHFDGGRRHRSDTALGTTSSQHQHQTQSCSSSSSSSSF